MRSMSCFDLSFKHCVEEMPLCFCGSHGISVLRQFRANAVCPNEEGEEDMLIRGTALHTVLSFILFSKQEHIVKDV